jgi:hypothetical protein
LPIGYRRDQDLAAEIGRSRHEPLVGGSAGFVAVHDDERGLVV